MRFQYWTDEEIETLKTLWSKGFNGTYIGAVLRKSRNSVMGQISRLRRKGDDLKNRPVGAVPTKEKTTVVRKKPKRQWVKPAKIPKPILVKEKLPPVNPANTGKNKPVSFANLKRHKCKYVINDGHPSEFLFCGEPTKNLKPFCEYHHAMCYTRAVNYEKSTKHHSLRIPRH